MPRRILMCPPEHFGVEYVINPWMRGHIGRTNRDRFRQQWDDLHAIIDKRADVTLMEPVEGLPDLVFVANAGLILNGVCVPAIFRYPERKREETPYTRWFEANDFEVSPLTTGSPFEGEGDALFQPGMPILWAGYGPRSTLMGHRGLSDAFDVEVVSLRLTDERFYHLDTCFAPLYDGRLLWFPGAFDEPSRDAVEGRIPAEKRIEVSDADAAEFCCNAVPLDDAVIFNHASSDLQNRLKQAGLEPITTPLNEFMLAGGGAKCLTLFLDNELAGRTHIPSTRRQFASTVRQRRVALEGHLLDRGSLSQSLDIVTEEGGDFTVDTFKAGHTHDEPSSARVTVVAPSPERLNTILNELLRLGAEPLDDDGDAQLVAVEKAGVAPEGFYSTTIYPTDVLVGGHWVRVTQQRMDAVIAVDNAASSNGKPGEATARCKLIRDLTVGESVVVGVDGLRVHRPKPREADDGFAFMTGSVSSERRVEVMVDQLAWEMRRIRQRDGKIVVVAGPVVIHTGGGPYLAKLIRGGFVQALLGGNAIAVHDLELHFFGTSLGVNLDRGSAVTGGHQHHIRTINEIRRHGSIKAAVDAGRVTDGVMHALETTNTPYILAGSIRDDGPLPETQMDLLAAQNEYQHHLAGADMVIMLASMLHSIGVGNMTPAGVKLVCVDISPAVVTKLADRGSLESVGIVTDVGLFLNLLAGRLGAAVTTSV